MMSRAISLFLLLVLAAAMAGCASAPASPDGAPFVPATGTLSAADPSAVLGRLTADVNATLEEIDRNVATAASALGDGGISGDSANATLGRLAASSPHTADAVAIGTDGRIAAAMPEEFAGVVGSDVGNQPHVQRGLSERQPLMSDVFRATEGFEAVVIQRPLIRGDRTFVGLVSAVIEPDLLLADRADRAITGTAFTAWAMAPDGRIVYDADASRIGRNVVTDPAYAGFPEFVAMAKRIAAEPSGSGSYTIAPPNGTAVQQDVVWGTAGLHGTGWRVVVVRAG